MAAAAALQRWQQQHCWTDKCSAMTTAAVILCGVVAALGMGSCRPVVMADAALSDGQIMVLQDGSCSARKLAMAAALRTDNCSAMIKAVAVLCGVAAALGAGFFSPLWNAGIVWVFRHRFVLSLPETLRLSWPKAAELAGCMVCLSLFGEPAQGTAAPRPSLWDTHQSQVVRPNPNAS